MSDEEKKGLQLYINPAECINCGACVYECPVEAIYNDEEEAIAEGELDAVKKRIMNFLEKSLDNSIFFRIFIDKINIYKYK